MYEEIGKKLKSEHGKKIKEKFPAAKGDEGENVARKSEIPDFAKAMKQLRKNSDLSLEKLSEHTGINKQTLHSIENQSIRNPSFANLEKIASAFSISLNDFVLMSRSEFTGNLFKTTAADRWSISFEIEKGFSVYSYSPPECSKRDFFVGILMIQGSKKLRYWKFKAHAKACIQPWEGDVLFTYHGMNWRREEQVKANETLYYDASIPHTIENLSEKSNRVLLVTYPSIF